MAIQSIEFVEDLSRSDLNRLTQLLAMRGDVPTSDWLSEQQRDLASFPPQLKKPSSILPRIIMALDAFGPRQAYLCSTHRPLNPCLIHRLFVLISAETTTRLKRLRGNPYLPDNVKQFVKRLSSVNSLWMAPDLYRAMFSLQPDDEGFTQIRKGCEACILAAVGGKPRVVADLRANIVGRKKKSGRESRLMPLLDAWISYYLRGELLKQESESLGREVRQVRKQMQQARKQMRRNTRDGIVDEPQEGYSTRETQAAEEEVEEGNEKDEKSEHDFEGSIIDFYANLMSSTNLAQSNDPTEDIHPAFGSSLAFEPTSRTFRRQTQRRHSAYSESMYSQPANESRQSFAPQNSSAERQAREYRRLVEIEEEEEPARRSQQHEPTHRDTRWSDLYR